MEKRYLSDEEYRVYFFVLGHIREALAGDLANAAGEGPRRIVDIASGHGLFALEVSRAFRGASICATGLDVDKATFLEVGAALRSGGLRSLPHLTGEALAGVEYVVSDVTALPFRDDAFDASVNFLGSEDVCMTRGRVGVRTTIREAARVTRPGGMVEIAVQIFGDTPADVLAKEIAEAIGHGAVFLEPEAYEAMMEDAGLRITARKRYSTACVLTASQAREELRYACEETPKVYRRYGVRTTTLEDIWTRFGHRIEIHGYALYSDVLGIFSEKRPD